MKTDKINTINTIHEKFISIVKLYEKLEKTPRNYGTDELFKSAEIHMLENIGDNRESLSVTDLATLMGITKGAVSQNLKKSENKGLTTKQEDHENSSRMIIKLTSKGKAAYYAHKHWHETMDGGYKNYYMNLEEDKIQFLLEFMIRVEDFLSKIITTEK